MASGTITDPYIKDPDSSSWDIKIDWSGWLNSGESISASSFSVTSNKTDITIDSDTNDSTSATVYLSGGSDGHYYRLTNSITTDSPRDEEQSVWVQCKQL